MAVRVVGLDVGTSRLKATEALVAGDGTAVLERFASVPLAPGVVENGVVREESRAELVSALKTLWREGRFRTKDVVLGLNSVSGTYARRITVPFAEPDVLRATLGQTIAERGIGSTEASVLDFVPLGESVGAGGERESVVFLVSASRRAVEANTAALAAAGLNVVGVDLNAFANLRATPIAHHDVNAVDAVVDVGGDVMSILLHHNGAPLLLILEERGGHGVTDFLKTHLGLSTFAEAEARKLVPDEEVTAAFERVIERLVVRVDQVLRDYQKANSDVYGFESVTLTGGGTRIPGLAEKLHARLGLPVVYGALNEEVLSNRTGTTSADAAGSTDVLVSAGLTTGTRIK